MPPEPLPWDRKDDFRERKHERSDSFGSTPRWRNSSAISYSSHYGSRELPRWGSPDFRRPPFNGKQGSWHQFEETSAHGCAPYRSSERIFGDETYLPSVSRGDFRHGRNIRDNRGSFVQRDWKSHAWGTNNGATNAIGRPCDINTDQGLVENMPTCSSPCHSDQINTWDQSQSRVQHDNKGSSNSGLNTGQRCEIETSLSPVEWKPLKWTRSGSLCSRSSGFSNSSSLKSLGIVESGELKDENLPRSATLLQSPPGNTAPCVTSAVSLEEATSRKKPRLGWGEGLAKYEKKKVEGPDLNVNKDGPVASANSSEAVHSLGSSLVDKSPRIMGFGDCASPATPSSNACSSSPGADDNLFSKAAYANGDMNNMCSSPSLGAWNHLQGFSFNLENLDNFSMANLAASLNELLQFVDPGPIDSSFIRSTAMNRLLIWKGDILKALESTESKIDLLENELRRLKSECGSFSPLPASSSSVPVEAYANLFKKVDAASAFILRPAPLQLDSSADETADKPLKGCSGLEELHVDAKGEDFDSPGTATSKHLEPFSLASRIPQSNLDLLVEDSGDMVKIPSADSMLSSSNTCVAVSDDVNAPIKSESVALDSSDSRLDDGYNLLCSNILVCNKESARQATDIFNKLLPGECSSVDTSNPSDISGWWDNPLIRQRVTARRRSLRFKEQVLAIRFKAFLNVWKEDMHLLSMRRCRPRSQKKVESGSRLLNGGFLKHRTHTRSRFSSAAGNLKLVPSPETVSLASKVAFNSQPRPYRDILKMPALILEEKEKVFSRFISSNGLVEDPCAVEKEKALMNPWTSEEKKIFMDKFATYGKDFKKIASFLDHKSTADSVEFYYKNHKSDCFEKMKKLDCGKQEKSAANTYLVTSGKKWNRQMNAASLDILGAVSAMAAHSDNIIACRSTSSSRIFSGKRIDSKLSKLSQADDGIERSSSFDLPEKETFAADILAGFCGSLSSEAMSSCITSCVDPAETCRDRRSQRVDSGIKRPSMSDITQTADDDTCSDDSCGETDPGDWTDEERSVFTQALSSYGKDFARVSRCIRTRSQEQCRVFFSKARKRLGLDSILLPRKVGSSVSDDAGGDQSDTEDACVLETSSAVCNDKLDAKMDEDLSGPPLNRSQDASDQLGSVKLETDLNKSEVEDGLGTPKRNILPDTSEVDDKNRVQYEYGSNTANGNCVKSQARPDQQMQEDPLLSDDAEDKRDPATADGMPSYTVASVAPCSSVSANFQAIASVEVTMEAPQEDSALDKSFVSETNLSKELCEKHDEHTFVRGSLMNSANMTSNQEADTSSLSGFCDFGCQSQVPIELRRSIPIPHLPDQVTAPVKLESSCDTVFQAVDKPSKDALSTLHTKKAKQDNECVGKLDHFRHVSGHPLVNHIDSSAILKGYPLQVQTAKEMDADINWVQAPEVQTPLKSDVGITNTCFARGFSFHQCNGLMTEHPVFSSEQKSGPAGTQSGSLSDTDKPCRNGDVKLFGKILTTNENEDKGFGHHSKRSCKPSILNFAAQESVDGQWASMRIENGGRGGHENVPIRGYGLWDGSRIQAGLSSLPDSAILLAKYPAAFANYSASSSTKEQQVLHSLFKTSEHNLNGVSVYPQREMCASNRVLASVVFRNHDGSRTRPVSLGRDMVFSGMQGRNSFQAVPSLQQMGRGMVGMKSNAGTGGVLGGGPCTGISDPVAALKMHYARAEQCIGQNGSVGRREEEAWKGKRDIGR